MFSGRRTGLFTTTQDVIGCQCALRFGATSGTVGWFDGSSGVASASATESTFHSVIGTNDGTTLNLYVDSVPGTPAATSGGSALIQPYALGNSAGGSYTQGQFLQGGIIDATISPENAALLSQQQHFFGGW
jgi:hypothetical protein